jgi:hypothetical protein
MAFDQLRYHQEVVVPLRDQPGGMPANDLLRQYAVELTMTPAELREHLARIRRFWHQRAGGIDRAAPIYGQLKDRDERLRAEHGDQMFESRWWQQQADRNEEDIRAESRRFAEDLARSYGAVGRLTRDQLEAIAAHWPGLSQHGIDEAVRLANLEVVEVVGLPVTSGMSRAGYRALKEALNRLGLPTVVQLLRPDLAGRSFRLLGSDAVVLDEAALRRQIDEAERAADSLPVRTRKDALGLVQTALRQAVELSTVALFQIVERLQVGRSQHLADGLLVRIATDAGLDQVDAQVVVASLTVGGEPVASPADRIRDLVQDGRLQAAQQALAVLPPGDAAADELRRLVEQRLAEVAGLRRDAEAAVSEQREEDAERMLRAAARIAVDDEEVTRRLDRLAPPPPTELAARPVDLGLRLSWSPPHSGGADVRYRVVRADRPPSRPGDGDLVGEGTEPELTDAAPPAGREAHYGVFASVGGDWSRPATMAIRVLPPITAVRLRAHAHEVTCGWRAHRAAEAVRVRRTIGRPPSSPNDGEPVDAALNGFVDRGAPDTPALYYSVVAVYRDERGDEALAPMVVLRAAGHTDAPAYVQRLRVHVTAVDAETAKVHVAWTTPASGTVSVRRAELQPTWAPGTTIRRDAMERYGEPIVGDRLGQGPETSVESVVPSGQFVYTPFTVDPAAGTAVVGEPVRVGVTEPVQDLRVRRTGTEAGLAWVWPPSVSLVEVAFAPADGTAGSRRLVTRGQYAESGCWLEIGNAGGRIAVRGVSRGRGGDAYSAAVSATVEGAPVGLEYHLDRLGGRFSRTRQLRVTVDRSCHDVELILVAFRGPVMPTRAEQGVVLHHFSRLTLTPEAAWIVPFETPRGFARPYWLRCFVARPPGVQVLDPIHEMKVA